MKNWNRIVVKIGTSTLCYPNGRLNIRHLEELIKVLSDIRNSGKEVLLVSSGAIAMGVGKLGLSQKPDSMRGKQAAAAIGQCELMYSYDKLFSEYNHNIGQILLTGDDLANDKKRQNFQNTIFQLLEYGAIPILNENDTMSTDEITSIGDNDTLAAIVAQYACADLLVLLSDIDGLYTADPHKNPDAKLLNRITDIDDTIRQLASGPNTKQGTGGMITKINAAEKCFENQIDMVIADGSHATILYDILDNKQVGTLFTKE